MDEEEPVTWVAIQARFSMRFKSLGVAITILFLPGVGVSLECREVKDETTAAQYLLDHKSNSTASLGTRIAWIS